MYQDCPLCGRILEAKQINLKEAVLLCADLNCPYPVNYECVLISLSKKNSKRRHTESANSLDNNIPDTHFPEANYSLPGGSETTQQNLMTFDTDAELNKLILELDTTNSNVNEDNHLDDFCGNIISEDIIQYVNLNNDAKISFDEINNAKNSNMENCDSDGILETDTINLTKAISTQNPINTDANLDKISNCDNTVDVPKQTNDNQKPTENTTMIHNNMLAFGINNPDDNISNSFNDTATGNIVKAVSEANQSISLNHSLCAVHTNNTILEKDESSYEGKRESSENNNTLIENNTDIYSPPPAARSIAQEIIMSFDEDDDGEDIFFD